MPETPKGYPIRISEEFSQGLATIWSTRVLDHIRSILSRLAENPEMGSKDVRPSLVRMYGTGFRKLVVSRFVIVYRFDGAAVDVLAIVYGPTIV